MTTREATPYWNHSNMSIQNDMMLAFENQQGVGSQPNDGQANKLNEFLRPLSQMSQH